MLDSGIEAALRRDRLLVGVALAASIFFAWVYLWWHAAMSMPAAHEGNMPASFAIALDPATMSVTFAMWVVMMAAMMLPSAAPTVLLYAAIVRRHAERGRVLPAVWVFVIGYLFVWAGFSIAATLVQGLLEHTALLGPTMASASKPLTAALLFAAGVYQITPLKDLCLRNCRNPVQFFMTRWRDGTSGALRMGMSHGAYCVGCCWMLMLLLFGAGVMNLLWVALIAIFIFVEKLLPAGRFSSRFAGVALIGAGLVIILRS